MKKTLATLLVCAQLVTGCASPQPARDTGAIGNVTEWIKPGDNVKVVKTDGTSLDVVVDEVKPDGIAGKGHVFVAKQDISRIEKRAKSFEPGAAEYAKVALVIVILPFMILCTALSGDNRSSGSCGWGH